MPSVGTINALTNYRKQLTDEIEKLRRTDEYQMSHDHAYDEALDDVIEIINKPL